MSIFVPVEQHGHTARPNDETQSPTPGSAFWTFTQQSLIDDEISILMKLIERHLAARLPVCFDGAVDSNGRVPGKRTLVGRHASQAYLEEEELLYSYYRRHASQAYLESVQ